MELILQIEKLVSSQKEYFNTHETFDINFRIKMLRKLYASIQAHEADILKALQTDLGKSATEGYMCEVGMTLSELSYQIKHIRKWCRNKTYPTGLANFHAKSFTVREPYGCVLIMSPWNYPFMLCMEPLVGALAAGNCCVVKPSAYSPATSAVIKLIIEEVFKGEHVAVVEGGRQENQELLEQRFDYIFFTGGVSVGKYVMEKAAKHLTPVTLELGGKSPCIITDSCNLEVAATRVAFGKYLNCGQTCVAPDYCLVDEKVKNEFVRLLLEQINIMYGENPLTNASYGKIINRKHFDRLLGLITPSKVVIGGLSDADTLKIAPTVLVDVTEKDPIMQEEIFGPLLPVLTYKSIEEAENNDTIVHLATSEMGFGGVGNSGMGSYHGKRSFDTFSHEKSILKKYYWIDLPMRYQPYKPIYDKLIRMFLH